MSRTRTVIAAAALLLLGACGGNPQDPSDEPGYPDDISSVDTLDANPYGMALSPSGDRLYISMYTGNEIQVFDTSTLDVVQTLPAQNPEMLALSRDGERLFASTYFEVLCFETQGGTQTGSAGPVHVRDMTTTVDDAQILGVCYDGSIAFIDQTTMVIDTLFNLPWQGSGESICMNPDGGTAYTIRSESYGGDACLGEISVPQQGVLRGVSAYGAYDSGNIACSPDGELIYIGIPGENRLDVRYTGDLVSVSGVTTCGRPQAISFSPSGEYIAVACQEGDSWGGFVQILDAGDLSSLEIIVLERNPAYIAWSPDSERLYAACGTEGGGSLLVVID